MTGWRLGYIAAPEPIAAAIDSIQSHSTSNPTSFAQKGALAGLKGDQSFIGEMVKAFSGTPRLHVRPADQASPASPA